MIREIAYGFAGLVLAITVDFLFGIRDDPREPPRLRPKIPLVGHAIGLFQYGTGRYSSRLSQRTDAEMYTLGIFHVKVYVCNNRRLVPLIQRSSKTLSLRPLIQLGAKKYAGANDETYHLFGRKLADEFGDAQTSALSPGPHLDKANLRMGKQLIVELEGLLDIPRGMSKTIKLYKLVKDTVVQATGSGIYGANHHFRDPVVNDSFWKWQPYLAAEMTGLGLFTAKGRAARDKVIDACRKYNESSIEDAAYVVHERHRVLREAGISPDEIAKRDATFPIAMFANTIPTLYWAIWELFSRPTILKEVRDEIESRAVSGSKQDGFVLDVAALKSKCPLLLSMFEETQRTRHIHANTRAVLSDTLLDNGKYLLKAGNYLLVPGRPIHSNVGIWGPSALEFDPYRFIPKKGSDREAVTPSAFLAWGAPPHLCPGRQFASTEILIALALLAVRADLQPSRGSWEKNPALNYGEHAAIESPKRDVDIEVKVRDRWTGDWSLTASESLSRIPLASG
ncbi:cytochrome P450 [Lindgomyces ingoldianus]|uniref:Cytochrome P450 n=1 Tax=Lindgomyces ingoldianus TaxID=673940 RepID=A0ACB6QPF2_9PLEO|nr:cytochrome P450 [Lindgomyces ingoldianus]KAF2468737.1 cytochrome P450 [Lindgomyces ingoldianus]